jgi:flagellar biogenesis protein FliO
MVQVADPILSAPDAVPSLWGAFLRLAIGVGLLAAGAAAWLYWHRRVRGTERHVEVMDRAFLARGVSVALLRVGTKRLLVGVSNEGVRLIRDLEQTDLPARRFSDVLAEAAGEVKR